MKYFILGVCFVLLFSISASASHVANTFDSGFDGWTYTVGVSWQSAGGNPNGYLRFEDSGPANGGQLLAPSSFLGDWSIYQGGTLRYDFKVFQTQAPTFSRMVSIRGNGGLATWKGPKFCGPIDWTTITVPIVEDAWSVSSGKWEDIIKNVSELKISMIDSSTAIEITGVDNIHLSSAPETVYRSFADFDKDGDVDAKDLAKFISVYGSILNQNPITVPWTWDNIPLGYFCDNWAPNDTDPNRVCTISRPDYSSTYARICNLKNGQAQVVPGTIDETFMQASSSGAVQFTTGEVLISNMFDSEWGDSLGVNDHFNTVWNPNIVRDTFEVISQTDVRSAPSTTMNQEAYFFSYDPNNISLDDWVDYLEFIKLNFKKSIARLVIYAHGNIGSLWITNTEISTVDLQTDESIRNTLKRLRNILSPNGHILLFSCNTGQDVDFIRELSVLSQAYVHANSNATGFPEDEAPWFNCVSNSDCTDWQLDLVCNPAGECHFE